LGKSHKKTLLRKTSLVKNLFPCGSFDDKIPSSLRCSKPLAENLNPIEEEESHTLRQDIFSRKPISGFDEEKVIVPKTQYRQIPKIPYKVLDAPAL
jgi:hypothetical protein